MCITNNRLYNTSYHKFHIVNKIPQSVFIDFLLTGFADSSWILLSDLSHIKSEEVFLAHTHNILPSPKVIEVARRVTLAQNHTSKSLALEELLEAPAPAARVPV